VKNAGNSTANEDWYDYLYLSDDAVYNYNDTYITSESIATQTPLAADASYTIQSRSIVLPTSATAGQKYLIFRANPYSDQGEVSKTNNDLALPITLDFNGPDLQILSASAPAAASIGSQVNVSWTVKNVGKSSANDDWYDLLYLSNDAIYDYDDTFLVSERIATQSPLATDASYTIQSRSISLPSSAAAGQKYLIFRANPYSDQGEVSQGNNVLALPITITASPPVVVSNVDHQVVNVERPVFTAKATLAQVGSESLLVAQGINASSIDLGGRQSFTSNTVDISAEVSSSGAQSEAIGLDNSNLWLRPGDDVLTINALISGSGTGRSVAVRNSFLSGNRGDDIITLNGDYWGDRAVVFGGDGNDRIIANGIGLDSFIQAGSGDDFVSVGRLEATPGAQPLSRRTGGTFTPCCIRGGAGFDVLQLRDTTQAQFQAEASSLTGAESGWLFRGWQISGFETLQFA
jgi:hypothetical protein